MGVGPGCMIGRNGNGGSSGGGSSLIELGPELGMEGKSWPPLAKTANNGGDDITFG